VTVNQEDDAVWQETVMRPARYVRVFTQTLWENQISSTRQRYEPRTSPLRLAYIWRVVNGTLVQFCTRHSIYYRTPLPPNSSHSTDANQRLC